MYSCQDNQWTIFYCNLNSINLHKTNIKKNNNCYCTKQCLITLRNLCILNDKPFNRNRQLEHYIIEKMCVMHKLAQTGNEFFFIAPFSRLWEFSLFELKMKIWISYWHGGLLLGTLLTRTRNFMTWQIEQTMG